MTALTDAQKEAIRACITTDQRVEFNASGIGFYVYTRKMVLREQFAYLQPSYAITSVVLLKDGQLRVMFWPL